MRGYYRSQCLSENQWEESWRIDKIAQGLYGEDCKITSRFDESGFGISEDGKRYKLVYYSDAR